MSKYKPVGWRGEPHRHYLAAKGIKSKNIRRYFQTKGDEAIDDAKAFDFQEIPEDAVGNIKTPRQKTAQQFGTTNQSTGKKELQRVRARGRLTDELAQRERESRPISKAIREIETGQYDSALDILEAGGIERPDARALRAAMSAQALQQAQAGIAPPDDVFGELEPAQARRIQRTLAAKLDEEAELTRGPIAQRFFDLNEEVKGAVAEGVAVGPGEELTEGLRFVGGAAEASEKGLGRNALLNRIDNEVDAPNGAIDSDLADNPLLESNAFIGNEEQQRPLSQQFDNIPSLNNNFDFLEEDGRPPTNPVFQDASKQETMMDRVKNQVEELHNSKRDLAKVDLSSYDKGNKAFEDGDREGLISAINDLKAEETTLQDRFKLVEQARNNVTSVQNFSGAFEKKSGNAVFQGGLFSSGGSTLADQTDKINEVRQDIVNANEKAFSRRRMLENRLKRLDSTVPPETTVPQKVDRFKKQDSGFGSLFSDNPLIGGNK